MIRPTMHDGIKKTADLVNLLLIAFILCSSDSFTQTPDRTIANRIFADAFEHRLIDTPIGEVIAHVGKQFLGTPYEEGTLDKPDPEQLVCNIHSFDCVTYVENVLALSRCIKKNTLSYDAYRHELQALRYRGGRIDGYASRLHYFTDWIYDNQQKGIVKDVTKELGGTPYRKTMNFMSTHRQFYPKLSNDSSFIRIKEVERDMAHRRLFYIPKSAIPSSAPGQSRIKAGDIIAITTTREGLDISHTGIAITMEDGTLHYLHAPDVGDSVRITTEPLWKYLQRHPAHSGIMVIKPIEPKE